MIIKHLDDTRVDVFVDKGWENWTRFEIKRVKGKVYPTKVAGKPLTTEQFKKLCEDLK